MKKKLVPIGNGWSLYMPVHILKLMGVNPKESKVIFEIEENILKITKLSEDISSHEKTLVRKFIKSGHGFALYIPNTILELLEVNPEKDYVTIKMFKQTLTLEKKS